MIYGIYYYNICKLVRCVGYFLVFIILSGIVVFVEVI